MLEIRVADQRFHPEKQFECRQFRNPEIMKDRDIPGGKNKFILVECLEVFKIFQDGASPILKGIVFQIYYPSVEGDHFGGIGKQYIEGNAESIVQGFSLIQ